MNAVQIEQTLTAFWAAVLSLEVDNTILRGPIPPNKDDCCGVILGTEITDINPHLRKQNCQLLGMYEDRDMAMNLHKAALDALPVESFEIVIPGDLTVKIRGIHPRGDGGTFPIDHKGSTFHQFSLNFIVIFES